MNCDMATSGEAGYPIKHRTCGEKGIGSVYYGETSSALYTRLKEHAKGLKEKHEENLLYKHVQISHENESVKSDYVPHKFFFDPLARKIDEGIRINVDLAGPTNIMNSKSEFKQGVVPRMEMVTGIRD